MLNIKTLGKTINFHKDTILNNAFTYDAKMWNILPIQRVVQVVPQFYSSCIRNK